MNPDQVCVICGKETTRMACYKCQRRMNSQLNDILMYQSVAENELLPGQGGDGRSRERTIGLRVNALDFAAGFTIVDVLELWERDWRETFGLSAYGPASLKRNEGKTQSDAVLRGVVGFLQSWMDKACDEHPAIDAFHGEVDGCWREARTAANQQPRTAWMLTCPSDVDDGECGNVLRVSGEDFDGSITCKKCHTTWMTHRLLMVVVSSTEALLWLDASAIGAFIGLTERTIRSWAKDGQIERRNGLYNFRDVIKVATHAI